MNEFGKYDCDTYFLCCDDLLLWMHKMPKYAQLSWRRGFGITTSADTPVLSV